MKTTLTLEHFFETKDNNMKAIQGLVSFKHLPENLSLSPNPRIANLESETAKSIRDGVVEDYESPFYLRNKGITLLVKDYVKQNNNTFELVLDEKSGLCDGGHTYSIIQDYIDNENYNNQLVKITIVANANIKQNQEMSSCLNRGQKLQESIIDALSGTYDYLEQVLQKQKYFSKDIFRKNGKTKLEPKSFVTLIEGAYAGVTENKSINIYGGKENLTKKYKTHIDDEVYKATIDFVPELIDFYQYLQKHFLEKATTNSPNFKKSKKPALIITGEKDETYTDEAYIAPIYSNFCKLLQYKDGEVYFTKNPKVLFDKYGSILVDTVIEGNTSASAAGRNTRTLREVEEVFDVLPK